MSKLAKTYLVLGVVCSVVGILLDADVIDASDLPAVYVALPLGVVFLGLFLIYYMLGKEAARFEAERTGRH